MERGIKNSRLFIALFLVFIVGCTATQTPQPSQQAVQSQGEAQGTSGGVQAAVDWKEIELKDVITGKTFKISDFKGKPIFVETMAVCCPLCTQQQIQLQKVADELGDSVVHVSIDTDLIVDEAKLKQYS